MAIKMSTRALGQVMLILLYTNLLHVSSVDGMRFCGGHLVQALQVVCLGAYNPQIHSSSISEESGDEVIPPGVEQADSGTSDSEYEDAPVAAQDPSPPLTPSEALAEGPQQLPSDHHRPRRSIHEACCVNTCTYQDIESYCQ